LGFEGRVLLAAANFSRLTARSRYSVNSFIAAPGFSRPLKISRREKGRAGKSGCRPTPSGQRARWRLEPVNSVGALPKLYRAPINKSLGALASGFLVFTEKVDAASNVTFSIYYISSEF